LSLHTFIFEPADVSDEDVLKGLDAFDRNMRIKNFFESDDQSGKEYVGDARFRVPNPLWQPERADAVTETFLTETRQEVKHQLALNPAVKRPKNWSDRIVDTIDAMCKFYDAMIAHTDKGLGFILSYRKQYCRMAFQHLNTPTCYTLQSNVYERKHVYPNPNHRLHPLNDTISTKKSVTISGIFTKLKYILLAYNMLFVPHKFDYQNTPTAQLRRLDSPIYYKSWENKIPVRYEYSTPIKLIKTELTQIAYYMLQLEYTPLTRISLFHIYIKIHKAWNTHDNIKGRPIVSSINSPTYFPSKYLDKKLQPLIKLLPTNLKDTTTLLLLLYERKFDPNIWFLTADVTALYLCIDIKDALVVIKELLLEYRDVHIPEISTENKINFFIELMKLVLDNNYVEFGDI
jgi:hypothetical protein